MKIERWDFDKHEALLSDWIRGWKLAESAGAREFYPSLGFVVDDSAIGFLYLTNAPAVGYIDGIVTRPGIGAKQKRRALDKLVELLVAAADVHDLALWAFPTVEGLVPLGQKHGFVRYSHATALVRVRKGS